MSERSRGDLPLRKADLLELGVPTALLDRIAEAVSSTLGVLLEGETGTGKTHLAQLISDLGPRADKPFILQNCAALPEGVFAAELFGHTRGAFTGAVQARRGLIEAAHKGTLFLDEIAELWPEQQAALLDALDRGMFRPLGSNQLVRADLRLITATNRNLLLGIRNRTFRQDLYHRCAVIHLRLPPLRERNHEIPTLITRLLGPIARKHALENGHETFRIPEVSPDALSLLRNHPLPGNIRDLQHALSLAVVRCNGGAIEPSISATC